MNQFYIMYIGLKEFDNRLIEKPLFCTITFEGRYIPVGLSDPG